jgi:hypothetical protein
MAKAFFWKIWLRPNLLTKKVANDYVAEVSLVRETVRNEDIAKQIVDNRSELRYETILSILSERDAVVRNFILQGSSVQDGNIHLAPRVMGNWVGIDPVFNPALHKMTVDAIPTTTLRTMLNEEVGVELLGVGSGAGAYIGHITDVGTGLSNGELTSGGDLIIIGEKIKVSPLDPSAPLADTPLGIFFTSSTGTVIPLDEPITMNTPRKIICRIPKLVKNGTFKLKIVTRFSSSSSLLKEPRTIAYDLLLKEGVIPG